MVQKHRQLQLIFESTHKTRGYRGDASLKKKKKIKLGHTELSAKIKSYLTLVVVTLLHSF